MNNVAGVRLDILRDISRNPEISTRELIARRRINTRHHLAGLEMQDFVYKTFKGKRSGFHEWKVTPKGLRVLECLIK